MEYVIFMIWINMVFIIGLLAGCGLTNVITRAKSVGSLRIDTSDPDDGPHLFLELSKEMNVVYKKKYVTLKVNTIDFIDLISHK